MFEPIESTDHGCFKSEYDQMAEAEFQEGLIRRVASGETTYKDALYLCGQLGLSANILRK